MLSTAAAGRHRSFPPVAEAVSEPDSLLGDSVPPSPGADSLAQLEEDCRGAAGRLQQGVAALGGDVLRCTADDDTPTWAGPKVALVSRRSSASLAAENLHISIQSAASCQQTEEPANMSAANTPAAQKAGSRRQTDLSTSAENAWLRHELASLRTEHVVTQARYVAQSHAHSAVMMHGLLAMSSIEVRMFAPDITLLSHLPCACGAD